MGGLGRKKRRWIVIRMLEGKWSVGWIAAQQRVSRRTCYNLLSAYLQRGWDALDDHPPGRTPVAQPLTTDQRRAIVAWRKESGIGAQRMEFLMQRGDPHWPADWPSVPHNRILALFHEANLVPEGRKRGPRHRYIRFEREHSNSLWQTDWHWLSETESWLIAYLDDHSRFLTGAGVFEDATTANALDVFEAAGQRFGYPKQVLSDHGAQFTSTNPLGEHHAFETRLGELGVEHIMGKVKKPTTTGKIERFFFTYDDELRRFPSLEAKVFHYNFERPHLSLDYEVPAVVFGRGYPVEANQRGEVLAYLSAGVERSPRASWRTGGK